MKLSQLKAFLTTVKCGTFSEAALELDMSQSAVSYAVAELEKSLGVTLLNRGRGGASATEIGEEIASQARQLFQTEETIRQLASRAAGALRGTLHVLTFRSVASRVLPPILSHLARHHEGLQVKLLETNGDHDDTARALHEGRVDLAFVQLPFSDDFLQWQVLRDSYVVVRQKNQSRGKQVPHSVSWKELAETPLILYGNHESTAVIEQYLRAELGSIEPKYQVKEDSTLIRMVAEGLGLTLMPELAVESLPENVETAALPEPLERSIGIAVAPKALKMPAVRAFMRALRTKYPESAIPELSSTAGTIEVT